MPFPGSDAAARPADVRPALPAYDGETAPVLDWPKFGAAALVIAALLLVGYLALGRGGDDDDDPQQAGQGTITANGTRTPGVATQSTGEGGAAATSTRGTIIGVGPTNTPGGTDEPEGTAPVDATGEPEGDETAVTGDEGEIVDPAELGIIQVEAQEGQTLIDIAAEWGLEVSTLVWANGIEDPGMPLPAGTLITIPPWDGVIHEVAAGETLESIAALYGVAPIDIINIIQNDVQGNEDLYPGLLITVPNATPQTRGGLAEYAVNEGDDLWLIASYYGIDPLTIAYANEIPSSWLIFPGQVLIIPPADGILYWTVEGDTVESIAAAFGVDPALIRDFAFNNVPGTAQPTPGQPILIPGLTPVVDASKGGGGGQPASDPFASPPAQGGPGTQAVGSFIWPASGNITTTFGDHHLGLDIANAPWAPVVAADGGKVTFAGWNEHGLGYAVAVDHENGYVTWYGHLAEPPSVAVGQRVAQGDWLGPMGSTGKSTGPHLHFVVILDGVYQDPMSILP